MRFRIILLFLLCLCSHSVESLAGEYTSAKALREHLSQQLQTCSSLLSRSEDLSVLDKIKTDTPWLDGEGLPRQALSLVTVEGINAFSAVIPLILQGEDERPELNTEAIRNISPLILLQDQLFTEVQLSFYSRNLYLEDPAASQEIQVDPFLVAKQAMQHLQNQLSHALIYGVDKIPQPTADILTEVKSMELMPLIFTRSLSEMQQKHVAAWISFIRTTTKSLNWSHEEAAYTLSPFTTAYIAYLLADRELLLTTDLNHDELKDDYDRDFHQGVLLALKKLEKQKKLIPLIKAVYDHSSSRQALPKSTIKMALKSEGKEKFLDAAAELIQLYLKIDFEEVAAINNAGITYGFGSLVGVLEFLKLEASKRWQSSTVIAAWVELGRLYLDHFQPESPGQFLDRKLRHDLRTTGRIADVVSSIIEESSPKNMVDEEEALSPATNVQNSSSKPVYRVAKSKKPTQPNLLPKKWRKGDEVASAEEQTDTESEVVDFDVDFSDSFLSEVAKFPGLLEDFKNSLLFERLKVAPQSTGSFKNPTIKKPYRVARYSYKGHRFRILFVIDSDHRVCLLEVGLRKNFYETFSRKYH